MPLPLPNLDTPRYRDLVDDAHALIPRYAPAWTDHNESDPGITLVELLAWLVEQDIYRVNQIPDRHRRKFLQLAGVSPAPPRAARAVLSLSAPSDVHIPIGTLFEADGVPFTSRNRMRIAQTALAAVQSWDGRGYRDLTADWRAGVPFSAWGADPGGFGDEDPPALLLGFDSALPQHGLSLWLALEGGADRAEVGLMEAEDAAQDEGCAPLRPRAFCGEPRRDPLPPASCAVCHEDCLRTVWELWYGGGWHELQVDDTTHGLMLDGLVYLLAPVAGDEHQIGAVPTPLRWLRCRAAGGLPDAPPLVTSIASNAVLVEQRVPAATRLPLAPGAQLPTPPLAPRQRARLAIEFDAAGQASRVTRTTARTVPKARVLAVSADALELTLTVAGSGLGIPELSLQMESAPVAGRAMMVWSDEDGWRSRPDLDASRPRDRDFVLDPQSGLLAFGDGEHGLAPRAGTTLLASYDVTLGGAGNLPAGASWSAPDHSSVHAAARGPSSGGADSEDLDHAAGRAAEELWAHERLLELAGAKGTLDGLDHGAVTALPAPQRAATAVDFERLALTVPGTRVERARAWPEIDAERPGLRAPGTVSVVVLNSLPASRPEPSHCLLTRVRRYLSRRKTLGTRLVVAAPDYVEVTATVTLVLSRGAEASVVSARATDALRGFIAPLRWPFGRDVFRSEVLALLDAVDGVDAVAALELTPDGGEPSCGNVCIGPTQLPVSGAHRVGVAT